MEGPPPLRQNDPRLYRIERETGSIPREKAQTRGILGTLAAIGIVIVKFFAPLLKLLPFLKTGLSMLLMIVVYAQGGGWWWALGFVLLLFVHECGHLIVAKYFGLNVSAPVFIPFIGAMILLKEAPRNAWVEACIGIGGPILGSIGALVCHVLGVQLDQPLLISLALIGYLLNLFNLIPITPMDGGRIVTALSPWLWLLGLALMGALAFLRPNAFFFVLLIVILFQAIPRIRTLFRKRTDEEQRYFEVTPAQRLVIALSYFGLIAALVAGMHYAELDLQLRGLGVE
ncbi:MAG TPA: site-2 protease family protein [Chthoniobacteraceae bacterium]|jgi:Zn-dependent protease|nr:site-2 protease family protein [Chthoniobacteraceae bacterium]